MTGVAKAEVSEVNAAMMRLRLHFVSLLDATDPATHPVHIATLTGTLTFAHLVSNQECVETADDRSPPVGIASKARVGLDKSIVGTLAIPVPYLFAFDMAMSYLAQLVDLLPRARAYPSSGFTRLFTMYAPAASGHIDYGRVRDGFGTMLAQVQGNTATAERYRDRGMTFARVGQPLKTLTKLYNAKAKWFNGGTIYGATLMVRYLGFIYSGLGPIYAAEMYACTAAALAMTSDDTDVQVHVPKALLEIAKYAQQAGTWVDAARLTEVALLAYTRLLTSPSDYDKYPNLAVHHINAALELTGIRTSWPKLEPLTETAHKTTNWYKHLVEVVE